MSLPRAHRNKWALSKCPTTRDLCYKKAWDTRFIHLYTTCATCMNYLGESTRTLNVFIL